MRWHRPLPDLARRVGWRGKASSGLLLSIAAVVVFGGCRRIDAIEPPAACVGEAVAISGFGFGASQGASTVSFNGVDAGKTLSWSDSEIVVAVPAGATTGPVVVTFGWAPGPPVPFRVVECPAPGVAPSYPKVAVDSLGQPHVAFGQAGPALYYIARAAGVDGAASGQWGPVEPIGTLASFDFDLAVGADGTPHVVYQAPDPSPDPPIASPTLHRVRTAGVWSPAKVACPGEFMTSEFCGDLRLAVESDGLPVLFSKDADRYGSNWIKKKKYDGTTWPTSKTIEYGSVFENIVGYDAIVDPEDSWNLALLRNHMEPPLSFFRRIEHGRQGARTTLGQTESGADDFSVPSLVGSPGKVHLVWRDHATLFHRRFDLATSTWDPEAVAFHALSSAQGQRPLVTADPSGGDGAFAIWTEDGILYGAVFDGASGTWGAPALIAKGVVSPDLATVSGTVHIVWRGATSNDLRYTTLP